MKLRSVVFERGASRFQSLPDLPYAEVAVVGRSNVGKSSFVNRLSGDSSLARTSRTPGRTQQINLFKAAIDGGREKKRTIVLADLPGYGFAKLPGKIREELGMLIGEYLARRERLKMVLLLQDARRDPGVEEFRVRDLVFEAGRHLGVIVTKCDKLSRGQRASRVRQVAKAFGLEPSDVLTTGEGEPPGEIVAYIAKTIEVLER